MAAVRIPEEFTVWVCYVTLALAALALTPKSLRRLNASACIHDFSGQRDAADQIAADRLPVFHRKDTDRIWRSCYAVFD